MTGVIGYGLQQVIKIMMLNSDSKFEIESLFGNSRLMAIALFVAGILIIVSSYLYDNRQRNMSIKSAIWIGAIQGLCLPFRGFSRSGATISTGLILGVNRRKAEEFSFALAVVLTPVIITKEIIRLVNANFVVNTVDINAIIHLMIPSLLGMIFSFFAGLLALRWLSSFLEDKHWHLFGWYCFLAALIVLKF